MPSFLASMQPKSALLPHMHHRETRPYIQGELPWTKENRTRAASRILSDNRYLGKPLKRAMLGVAPGGRAKPLTESVIHVVWVASLLPRHASARFAQSILPSGSQRTPNTALRADFSRRDGHAQIGAHVDPAPRSSRPSPASPPPPPPRLRRRPRSRRRRRRRGPWRPRPWRSCPRSPGAAWPRAWSP
ncbi:hypothetical protein VTK73DRAFT_5855 [Phialemonium thermophilum]|uniref:Recombinase domain-containing protein n=1 Tax=Phialemonium thermophilum TaxID=223376 RepID=A0ABR3V0Y6_9PEZI